MYIARTFKISTLFLFLISSVLMPSSSQAEETPKIEVGKPSIGTGYSEHRDGKSFEPISGSQTVNNYYYYDDDGYSCYDNYGNYYGDYCAWAPFPFYFFWGGQRYFMNNWGYWNNWNRRYYPGRNIGDHAAHRRDDRIDRRNDLRDNRLDRRDKRRGDAARDRGGRGDRVQRAGPRGGMQDMRAGGPRGGQGMRAGGPRGGQGMRSGGRHGGGGMRGGGGRGGRR